MRHIGAVKLLVVLALLRPIPAAGESMVEVWRSPFGEVSTLGITARDGSCWATVGGRLIHVSKEGRLLAQFPALPSDPRPSFAVNPSDGSCWLVANGRLLHLSKTGKTLARVDAPPVNSVLSLAVDPRNGSCWLVGDAASGCMAVHVSRYGKVLQRTHVDKLSGPNWVAVDPRDDSCWVTAWKELLHLSREGVIQRRLGGPQLFALGPVAVSQVDGSVWVVTHRTSDMQPEIVHLTADGREVARVPALSEVRHLSVSPTDGSLLAAMWLSASNPARLVRIAADGHELWRKDFAPLPVSYRSSVVGSLEVSQSPTDGSCWVAHGTALIHLGADGKELMRVGGFRNLRGVATSPTDGACWVADGNAGLLRVAADGHKRWQSSGFRNPVSLAANPEDGSCWVADPIGARVAHLSKNGKTMWSGGRFRSPSWVSVNPKDGSCYVADSEGKQVARLAADGSDIWRKHDFTAPSSVTVSSRDGSCWVVDAGALVHLSAEGVELTRGPAFATFPQRGFAVSPLDGSYWASDVTWDGQERPAHDVRSAFVHLSPEGRELLRLPAEGWWSGFEATAVSPVDGSCWVAWVEHHSASWGSSKAIHLAPDGTRLWETSGWFGRDVRLAASPDGSCWVTTEEQLVHLSAAGKELSRSPAVGDEIVAPDPAHKFVWAARPDAGVVLRFVSR